MAELEGEGRAARQVEAVLAGEGSEAGEKRPLRSSERLAAEPHRSALRAHVSARARLTHALARRAGRPTMSCQKRMRCGLRPRASVRSMKSRIARSPTRARRRRISRKPPSEITRRTTRSRSVFRRTEPAGYSQKRRSKAPPPARGDGARRGRGVDPRPTFSFYRGARSPFRCRRTTAKPLLVCGRSALVLPWPFRERGLPR
jgi:hypothetical protein